MICAALIIGLHVYMNFILKIPVSLNVTQLQWYVCKLRKNRTISPVQQKLGLDCLFTTTMRNLQSTLRNHFESLKRNNIFIKNQNHFVKSSYGSVFLSLKHLKKVQHAKTSALNRSNTRVVFLTPFEFYENGKVRQISTACLCVVIAPVRTQGTIHTFFSGFEQLLSKPSAIYILYSD